MNDLVDPQTGVVPERRPRVKLEELPQGQGWLIGIAVIVLAFAAIGALAVGAIQATGNLTEPLSEHVWTAQQQDAQVEIQQQTYTDYLADLNHQRAVSGTALMVLAPAILLLAVVLWRGAVTEVVKCPKGHVVKGSHSYCPVCASVIYTKDELAPAEWGKRYGDGSGVH